MSSVKPPPEACRWEDTGHAATVHEGECRWVQIGCTHEHVREGWSCGRHLEGARRIAASGEQVRCGLCGHACGLMILVTETKEVIRT